MQKILGSLHPQGPQKYPRCSLLEGQRLILRKGRCYMYRKKMSSVEAMVKNGEEIHLLREEESPEEAGLLN